MEFEDHAGPVYALHRVFTLSDADWPHLDAHENARDDDADRAPALTPKTVPVRSPR